MKKEKEELVVKVTKEIVVKFIEVGRLSVSSFDDVWNQVHQAVRRSLEDDGPEDQ
jgi:predicted transcriptional regulator